MKQSSNKRFNLALSHIKVLIVLLLSLLFFNATMAQITISTTDISCDKPYGTATINTPTFGFVFDYAVDGIHQSSNTFLFLSAGDHTAIVTDKNTKCAFSKNFTIASSLTSLRGVSDTDQPSIDRDICCSSLKVNISGINSSNAVCNTSPFVTLTANVTGGSGNYDYTWPGGLTNVSASGSYSVTIIDKETGCKTSAGGEVIIVPTVCSSDPNDIIGPEGFGEGRMISKFKQQSYTIRFENDPQFATAPAQLVKITQPLDQNANISSLRLGNFGFGPLAFEVPPNRTFYSNRLNVADSLGVVVDVTAGIDVIKKEAFWIFESIDPFTGLRPTNATLGFLPVNDSTAIGEGFVSYTIKAADHTKTGDTIHAKASIVFDVNEPLATPTIFNTIDAVAPTSKVRAFSLAGDSTVINLTWSGKDDAGGSGVRDYSLYVSQNGSAFSLYQAGLSDTTTAFSGFTGSRYSFFTLATDTTGNQEAMKSAGEVTVQLPGGGPVPVTWLYFKGQRLSNDVLLTWATVSEQHTKSFIVERSLDGSVFNTIGTLPAAGDSYQTNNYHYNDVNAASLNVNVLYYRLKQLDVDGKYSYSIVVAIPLKQNVAEPIITAFPNPTTGDINLEVNNYRGKELNVIITDIYGRKIHTEIIETNYSGPDYKLNLKHPLIPGLYIIKVSGNAVKTSLKVVVL